MILKGITSHKKKNKECVIYSFIQSGEKRQNFKKSWNMTYVKETCKGSQLKDGKESVHGADT